MTRRRLTAALLGVAGVVVTRRAATLFAFTVWALAGCGTSSDAARRESERQVFARSLYETAATAAVAKPGIKVCRMLTVGIAEQDWIKGVVVDADAGQVRVRIDETGRFPHVIDGVAIARGVVVRDKPSVWAPCY